MFFEEITCADSKTALSLHRDFFIVLDLRLTKIGCQAWQPFAFYTGTIYHLPSTIYYLLSTIYHLLSTIYYLLSTISLLRHPVFLHFRPQFMRFALSHIIHQFPEFIAVIHFTGMTKFMQDHIID
jgi:hypothetical protein